MEDVIAYSAWIDKFKERIAIVIQKAVNKREDRQMRNLKNKANGGFVCYKRESSLEIQSKPLENM